MRYAYVPETNELRPLLADGRDLTGFVLCRDGYYGRAGRVLERYQAGPELLPALTSVAARTGDAELWGYAVKLASALGLGDLGEAPGKPGRPEPGTDCASACALIALVRLYKLCGVREYLTLAERVADNLVAAQGGGGCFSTARHGLCSVNSPAPLAILELVSALDGTEGVPTTVYHD